MGEYASLRLRNDREFFFSALDVCQDDVGELLRYASAELRLDQEVVFATLAKDPEAVLYIERSLYTCENFVLRMMKAEIDPRALSTYLEQKLRFLDEASLKGIFKVIDTRGVPYFLQQCQKFRKKEIQQSIDRARMKLNCFKAERHIRKACISGDIPDLREALDLAQQFSPAKVRFVQDRLDRTVWERDISAAVEASDCESLSERLSTRPSLSSSLCFEKVLCRVRQGGADCELFHVMRRHLEEKLQSLPNDESQSSLQEQLSLLIGMSAKQIGGKRNDQPEDAKKRRRLEPESMGSPTLSNKDIIIQRVREFILAAEISLEKECKSRSRIYSLEDRAYGLRGGLPHYKPSGWVRISLDAPPQVFEEDWAIGYHGTSVEKIPVIVTEGLRGDKGAEHGQAGSHTMQSIYTTPSIEYAAHPVFAKWKELGEQHWVQMVVEVRVRPGTFREQGGTMANKHWPKDLRWQWAFDSLLFLEWLSENPEDVVVTGIMVREFGKEADPKVYGETASRVRWQPGQRAEDEDEPNFVWTELRAEEFKQRNLFIHCLPEA